MVNQPPVLDLLLPDAITAGEPITAVVAVNDSDGAVTSVVWMVNGEPSWQAVKGPQAITTFVLPDGAQYLLKIQAWDQEGEVTEETRWLHPRLPVAKVTHYVELMNEFHDIVDPSQDVDTRFVTVGDQRIAYILSAMPWGSFRFRYIEASPWAPPSARVCSFYLEDYLATAIGASFVEVEDIWNPVVFPWGADFWFVAPVDISRVVGNDQFETGDQLVVGKIDGDCDSERVSLFHSYPLPGGDGYATLSGRVVYMDYDWVDLTLFREDWPNPAVLVFRSKEIRSLSFSGFPGRGVSPYFSRGFGQEVVTLIEAADGETYLATVKIWYDSRHGSRFSDRGPVPVKYVPGPCAASHILPGNRYFPGDRCTLYDVSAGKVYPVPFTEAEDSASAGVVAYLESDPLRYFWVRQDAGGQWVLMTGAVDPLLQSIVSPPQVISVLAVDPATVVEVVAVHLVREDYSYGNNKIVRYFVVVRKKAPSGEITLSTFVLQPRQK